MFSDKVVLLEDYDRIPDVNRTKKLSTMIGPASHATYRYPGSLTTPPCSEGVSWLVAVEPIELSAEQIAAFTAIFHGNNRPVQPLGERTIAVDRVEG